MKVEDASMIQKQSWPRFAGEGAFFTNKNYLT